MLFGVNLEGLQWVPAQPPFVSAIQYYLDQGFYLFRLPIEWETIQPTLYGPLDPATLNLIDDVVTQVIAKPGATVILDLHNGGRRGYQIVGQSSSVWAGALTNLWAKLARHYRATATVWYGLMNEPHEQDLHTLAATLNGCIGAIRGERAPGNIVVPGSDWCNGRRWLVNGNATMMRQIVTVPGLVFEVHQYQDFWGSGNSPSAEPGCGLWLDDVAAWAKNWGCYLLLGETACSADAVAMTEMSIMITRMKSTGVWVGLCWWSSLGGHPENPANPPLFNLDPVGGVDKPQMALLR